MLSAQGLCTFVPFIEELKLHADLYIVRGELKLCTCRFMVRGELKLCICRLVVFH